MFARPSAKSMSSAPKLLNQPDSAAVRAQVERMTASSVFRSSPQLASFLLFIVEARLRGNAERLKGYTIGVEVLRRDTKFDPQLDPIVRVEATRLRRAIERYYAGPGATDPVIVDLPRGSYVPTFRRREMARRRAMPSIAAIGRWADALQRPLPSAWLAVMATIVIVSLAAVYFYGRRDDGIATATVAVRDL